MKAKAFFLLTITVLSFAAITLSSCSKDDEDGFNLSKGNLSGVWLKEAGNGTARGYIFSSTMCEGEYTFSDHQNSGHSKHAVGKWYYNNVIYVANPYFVDRDKVYVNNKLTFTIADGKLVSIDDYVYERQ
jgi:hypothetical protein